jgi:hypothetical protein
MGKDWDRNGECCKPECSNLRGTFNGVPDTMCDYHRGLFQARIERLLHDHPAVEPEAVAVAGAFRPSSYVQAPAVVFTPPPVAVLADEERCARCGENRREFPDTLCEECRRG